MSGILGASGFIGAAVGIGLSSAGQNAVPTLGGAFSTFGEVTFTVVGSPAHLEVRDRSYYAKIEVVNAPPVLQWLYDDLTVINMDILLHYIWCVPQTAVSVFQQMRVSHTPQPLTIGYNNLGNFFLNNIDEKDTWRADDGSLLVSMLKLELIEYTGQVNNQGSVPTYAGTSQAPPGSVVTYAPPAAQVGPGTNFQGVSLQDAVRMGGNAIVLAGNL